MTRESGTQWDDGHCTLQLYCEDLGHAPPPPPAAAVTV